MRGRIERFCLILAGEVCCQVSILADAVRLRSLSDALWSVGQSALLCVYPKEYRTAGNGMARRRRG